MAVHPTSSASARHDLICTYLPLVHRCVRDVALAPSLREDLAQAGVIGLIYAVDHFDPDRGVAFASYARPHIRGEILHHLRDRRLIKAPDTVDAVPIDALNEGDDVRAHACGEPTDAVCLRQAMAYLPLHAQRVLTLVFWLGFSQQEVADILGTSQTSVSRTQRHSVVALREALIDEYLD